MVTYEAGKEMARGSINDNIGGNYEYINSYFYSRLYYQWLFLGLVTYEVWKEMAEEFIKIGKWMLEQSIHFSFQKISPCFGNFFANQLLLSQTTSLFGRSDVLPSSNGTKRPQCVLYWKEATPG